MEDWESAGQIRPEGSEDCSPSPVRLNLNTRVLLENTLNLFENVIQIRYCK